MFIRLGMAVAVAATTLVGLAGGTAAAAPQCADFHWIGAAGSGQRDGANLTANGGMGDVVYQSYQQLSSELAASGRTITAEAVQYPAAPVPLGGGLGGWMDFMDSVEDGTDAAADQLEAFTARCPQTKVVLAGYSQGAMVIHRNLHDLADAPNVAAALLVADGDRLPADTTINLGSTAVLPGAGKGVAQDWPILAHAPAPLPLNVAARTVSVCDLGDAVCDYDPDAEDTMNPTAVAIHTSYARASTGGYAWTSPLYQLIGPAPTANQIAVAAG